MTDLPTNKLSIYLIKESKHNREDILNNFDSLKKEEIKYGNEIIGILYYDNSHIMEPEWITNFFGNSFKNNIELNDNSDKKIRLKLYNSVSKAILLIESQERIFALSFGYGRTLLSNSVWEERFGLKIVLNTIDADNLKHIDKRSMSSMPKDTKEQLIRGGVASDFGIDIEQDIIQTITGSSTDDAFGKTITGKDALSVSAKVNLSNIKEFLKNCYEKYLSDEYKKDFGWIDQIEEIKDINLIEKLNLKLVENIKNNEVEKMWMAVPELINWSDVLSFSYKNSLKNATPKNDISINDFLDSLKNINKDNLSIKTFKDKAVFCFSAQSEQVKYQWSAFSCLYCEINDLIKDKTHLLSNGKWYEVENDFSKLIKDDYLTLRNQKISFSLPEYNHKDENDYNEKVASDNNNFYCMDRKNITFGGGYSKIEFCDLLTNSKQIIHVKKYGGSSVLSHLFSQGVVSGELFIGDENFRKKVNKELPSSFKFNDVAKKPNGSDYEIIFAIISSSSSDLDIPFFSKVSLRTARRRLEAFGYKVSLQKIGLGTAVKQIE